MAEIRFDTGLVSYDINGAVTVAFNPTDFNFIERVYDVFDSLDKKQDEYDKEVGRSKDARKTFDVARAKDKEMRETMDGLFGVPVSDALFGDMNVYARAGGLPVWCNFLFALFDLIVDSSDAESKKTDPRLNKYLAKYKKK
jgi:hypothetical protein